VESEVEIEGFNHETVAEIWCNAKSRAIERENLAYESYHLLLMTTGCKCGNASLVTFLH